MLQDLIADLLGDLPLQPARAKAVILAVSGLQHALVAGLVLAVAGAAGTQLARQAARDSRSAVAVLVLVAHAVSQHPRDVAAAGRADRRHRHAAQRTAHATAASLG